MAPTDYSKRKNAELEELLKARGLPTGGKKAELVARLQASDAEGGGDAGAAARASTTTKEAGGEDEIDWDDDAAAGGAAATTASAAAAVAAGGQGQPPNPVAVPNQVPAQDPSKTSDLTAVKGSDEAATASEAAPLTTTTATTGSDTAAAAPASVDPAPAAPKEDFSSHIPPSSLTAELEKRKARAARFGLPATTAEETTKALERAKRFGLDKEPATESTGTETEAKADTTPSIVAGLDRALPERQQRKRGRGAAGGVEGGGPVEMGGDRGGKRRDSRQRRGGDAHQKTDKSNGNGSGSGSGKAKSGPGTGAGVGAKKEISEKDRLAAEARKKRFAAAAAT